MTEVKPHKCRLYKFQNQGRGQVHHDVKPVVSTAANQLHQVGMVGIFTSAGRHLKDKRAFSI